MSKVLLKRVAFGGAMLIFLLSLGLHVATFAIQPVTAEYVLLILTGMLLIPLVMIADLLLTLLAMPNHRRERDRKGELLRRLLLTNAPTSVRFLYLLAVLLGVYGLYIWLSQAISVIGSMSSEQLMTRWLEQEIQFIRGISALWMSFFLMQAVNIPGWLDSWHRREPDRASEQSLAGQKV